MSKMTPTEQFFPCPLSHCTNSSLTPSWGLLLPHLLAHEDFLLQHKCKMTPKTYTYKYTHKSLLSTVRMYTSPHTTAHNYWDHMYTCTPLYTWSKSIHMYTTVHMKPIYTHVHHCTHEANLYTNTHTQWLPGYLHKIAEYCYSVHHCTHKANCTHIHTRSGCQATYTKMPNNAILYKKPEIYFLHVHIASPTEHAQKPPTIWALILTLES